jgi:hypothetical protein
MRALRVASAVRGKGTSARRHVPAVRVVRVDGDRPGVVAVSTLVGRLPALTCVRAEGGTAAAGLVPASLDARVPGERVDVTLRAGAVILPALAAVARTHQPAQLDPDEEQVGVVRARGDPPHVRRPGPRREAPTRPRGQLEERRQLTPALAFVIASKQPARLGARVHRPVGRADGQREHGGVGQLAVDPAAAAVEAAADTALA